MDIIIRIVQVLLALSLLILVHEFGHFIFARIFKIRVEKFYLFFDPWFSIFKFKPKGSDTEYGIGWLPLGGYCKISGMIDESMDMESMALPPKPYEFRSKPAWQRLLVMAGGVLFNFVLAIIIYIGILFTWGDEYLKNEDAVYGIVTNDLSYEIGFRDGDKILALDNYIPEKFFELQVDVARMQPERIKVLRGTDTVFLKIEDVFLPAVLNTPGMFDLAVPFEVGEIPDTSLNRSAGLMVGDRIVAINSVPSYSIQKVQKELHKYPGVKNIPFDVIRDGEIHTINLDIDPDGRIQILLQNDLTKFFNVTTHNYSLVSAIPAGFKETFSTIGGYIKDLGLMFSPKTEAYKSVGSFIAIGQIFPTKWNWEIFWRITAMLSVMLAVLNLLPIPALDGGHIVFTLYEIITGRKPSDKFLEIAQIIGLLLLFSLIFLAFGNDIRRLFN